MYVALTLLVGLAAINRQNNLLFWILGVMLSALLLSGMVSGVMMQSLRVKRLVAGNALVGEPLAKFVELGLVADVDGRIGLTREGLLVSDAMWPEML